MEKTDGWIVTSGTIFHIQSANVRLIKQNWTSGEKKLLIPKTEDDFIMIVNDMISKNYMLRLIKTTSQSLEDGYYHIMIELRTGFDELIKSINDEKPVSQFVDCTKY